MTFWDAYKPGRRTVNPALLWEYNLSSFDWEKGAPVYVARVIERGWPEDWFAAFDVYGGVEQFRERIKQAAYMSDRDMSFVCLQFNLKKEDLQCYARKRSRKALFDF